MSLEQQRALALAKSYAVAASLAASRGDLALAAEELDDARAAISRVAGRPVRVCLETVHGIISNLQTTGILET